MRKLPAISCLILIGFLSSTAKGEKVFKCQTELATGFIGTNRISDLNYGPWRKANFEQQRYTIKFNDHPGSDSRIQGYTELKGLGSDQAFICKPAYSHKPHLVVCRDSLLDSGRTFIFNTKKLRFLYLTAGPLGYVDGGPDTDNLFAGTCQKF